MKLLHKIITKYRSSIRNRISGLSLLLSLGSLIIITTITLSTIFGQLRQFSDRLQDTEDALRSDVVGSNLASNAEDTALDIDSFMLERIEDIRRWGEGKPIIDAVREGNRIARSNGVGAFTSDRDQITKLLGGKQFIEIAPEIFSNAISFLFNQTERFDTPYIEILVTNDVGINVLITRPVSDIAHARHQWWSDATSPNLAGIGIIQPIIDQDTLTPVVGIALPIIDNDTKEIIGVIRALVNLKGLQRRLSQKAVTLQSDILLFTKDGQYIAETGSNHAQDRILNPNILLEDLEEDLMKTAFTLDPDEDNKRFQTLQSQDTTLIVGYAQTSGSFFYENQANLTGFSGFNWGLTVSQPENQALQILNDLIETGNAFADLPSRLGTTFLLMTILVGAAAIGGAFIVSNTISKPLIDLNQMSRQVQDGDLDCQVDVKSIDELGQLGSAFNSMVEGLRKREIERDIFGRVVTPAVRETLLSGNLALGGETRRVTVIFSDIRNFSSISEQMSPQDTITYLNEYLSEMSSAILPWEGYINNFVGDAIIAIFGAPISQDNQELRAIKAALSMRERLATLNDRRKERGAAPIESGIGISTGEAVAGQIGSMQRLIYTVIGDAVNVAARLEALTKELPDNPILMNKETVDAVYDDHSLNFRKIGPVHVKGKTKPVEVYSIRSLEPSFNDESPE